MAVCPEHPGNLIANWDFSNGFNNWSQSIVQGDGFFTHFSQCGTDKWPNEAAEADYDQAGGGWEVGDEAKIWQDVDASALSGYDHLTLSWAESHHTDLANPGIQVVTLYGSDNQSDWTQLWQRARVEEAARGAGKNCEELPQFTYVVPVPVTYDYYRLEFHAKVGSTLDGWLFSWVQLYPAGEAQVVPAVGATSTVTEVSGRNNQTVANDSITITEAGGVLLAVLACYDADGVAVGSSVVLDPGGPEEANFSFVAGQHDVSGAATLRVELWQLVDPPAGTFTVRGTVTATCHNVVVGVQQYDEIGGIGALVSNTRTLVNDSNAPPAVRLQPQTGSRVVMASIQRLLATYTAPGPGDTIRFQKQSQDGTSVRAVTVALVDTAVEADSCWTGLEVAAAPASIQEWAAIGVELLGVGEAGHDPLVVESGDYASTGQPVALAGSRRLTIDAGTHLLDGQPLVPRHHHLLVSLAGTHTLTGRPVGTLAGRVLDLGPGSHAVNGTPANLPRVYAVLADPGAYTTVGSIATLPHHRRLVAAQGAYVLVGQDLDLVAGQSIVLDTGSHSLVGSPLALLVNRLLDVDQAQYVTTGSSLIALRRRRVDVDTGLHVVSGQPLTIIVGQAIVLQPGSHLVDGSPLALTVNRLLITFSEGYEVTPRPVRITRGHVLRPSMGVHTLDGHETGLRASRLAILVKTVYNVSGQPVDLRVSNVFRIFLDRGTYGVNGGAPDLLVDRHLPVGAGATAITGSPVNLRRHYILLPTSGEILVLPLMVGLPSRRLLTIDRGAYPVDGAELGIDRVRTLLLSAGSHGYTGSVLDIIRDYYLSLVGTGVVITGVDLAMTYTGEIVPIVRVSIRGANRMTSVDGPMGSTTKGVRVRTHPK